MKSIAEFWEDSVSSLSVSPLPLNTHTWYEQTKPCPLPVFSLILVHLWGKWGAERATQNLKGNEASLAVVFPHVLGQPWRKNSNLPHVRVSEPPACGGSWLEWESIRSSFVGRESDLLYKSTLCQLARRAGWRGLWPRVRERAWEPVYKIGGSKGQAGGRFYLQN